LHALALSAGLQAGARAPNARTEGYRDMVNASLQRWRVAVRALSKQPA
jgi:hypothetical protein